MNMNAVLGNLYFKIGDYEQSYKHDKVALEICSAAKFNKIYVSHFLMPVILTISEVRYSLLMKCAMALELSHNYSMALEYYEHSLLVAKELKDLEKEANVNRRIATKFLASGNYSKAMDYLQRAITLARKAGSKKEEFDAYDLFGTLYGQIGDYEKAIEYKLLALKALEKVDINTINSPEKATRGMLYEYVAILYEQLWYEKQNNPMEFKESASNSAKFFWKAIDEYRRSGDNILGGNADAKLANLFGILEKRDMAKFLIERAIKIHINSGAKSSEMYDYVWAGKIYSNWGDYSKALEYLNKGLEISRNLGTTFNESLFLNQIGNVYISLGDYPKAITYLKEALLLLKERKPERSIVVLQLMTAFLLAGQYEKSKSYCNDAIKLYEAERGKLKLEELRRSFGSKFNVHKLYEHMIFLLLKMKQNVEAFNYTERAKSRTFLDLLGSKLRLNKNWDRKLSNNEQELQWKINSLQQRIEKEQAQPKEKHGRALNVWKEEIGNLRNEYVNLMIKIKHESPELSSLVSVDPLTLKEVQGLLDSDTTLLEYFVTQDKTLYGLSIN